jgi:calcineurin-like phosphoesterase family protein
MKTFFTADIHFGHDRILQIAARGCFRSVEVHDDYLADSINVTVGAEDRLFILGDFAWRAEESYLRQINCRNVHLIIGNHDRGRSVKLFKTAEPVAEIKIRDSKTFLSHYPHAYWPSSHHGSFHLYGHTHDQREAILDDFWPKRRSMDVGMDTAKRLLGSYRPFSEDEIYERLRFRTGHDPVEART